MRPFTLLYYVVSVLLYVVALPLIVFLAFKSKYKESIPARFFLLNNPSFTQTDAIWFHVCSLGEARALKPLLDLLRGEKILISTITQTGFKEASKYDAEVRYLPYEALLPLWVKKERLVVVLEAEFWYLLFSVVRHRSAKLILLNARISDNSAAKYLKFAWFYKKLLSFVDTLYVQSKKDKERFLELGATNIVVIGNIKLAGEIKKTQEYAKPPKEIIVAGSTHKGEEEAVVEAFVEYRKSTKSTLVVVPRHPERFSSIYALLQSYADEHNLSLSKFSKQKDFEADIVLCDMMGELNNIYSVSNIAILGGAFKEDVGGHNPLEPAFFNCKIITGKHFFHQKELFRYVKNVQYVEKNEILHALTKTKELECSKVEETIDLEPIVNKILKTKQQK